MAIKVVVVDAAQLPGGVEFPPLQAEKYSWEQYPALGSEEVIDRCWRTDILVSLGTMIDRRILDSLLRLQLVIVAGVACSTLDRHAAAGNGVEILQFPGFDPVDAAGAQEVCERMCAAIDAYINELEP